MIGHIGITDYSERVAMLHTERKEKLPGVTGNFCTIRRREQR